MTKLTTTKTTDATVKFPSRNGDIFTALSQINLTLEEGETLSVVGESGSGKSTLLRVILGLQEVSSGEVVLLGENLGDTSKQDLTRLRKKCGYIPQDPYGSLPPTLEVLEAVTEPWLLAYGRSRLEEGMGKARKLLEELGLTGRKLLQTRVRGKLSGGQRQRVAIARGLILDPQILLADEPTSMQDASTREDILEVLSRRTKKGMAMIFITHDLLLARKTSKETMILYSGHICELAPSSDLMKRQVHPYTQALYGAIPHLGKPMDLKTRGSHGPASSGCPFRDNCPHAMYVCEKKPPIRKTGDRLVACWLNSSER